MLLAELPPLFMGLFLGLASGVATVGLLLVGAFEAGRDAERRSRRGSAHPRGERTPMRRAA